MKALLDQENLKAIYIQGIIYKSKNSNETADS